LQQWWDSVIDRKSFFPFLSYLPKILLACVIPALDSIYSRVAIWLNDMGKSAKWLVHIWKVLLWQFCDELAWKISGTCKVRLYCPFLIWCNMNSGVNFINVLRAAFTRADNRSVKNTDDLTVFFTLLGSARTKAARKTLMKLTPALLRLL